MSKLALNMIAKDDSEADILYRCLSSIAPYVDGIYITVTNSPSAKVEQVIENFGGEASHFKWTKSFEEARNYALSQVPEKYDYIVWCDTDDVWENADKLPDIVRMMDQQGLTSVFLDYNYEIDPDTGKVNIVHPRERVVKRGYYEWKGHLHETLIPTREVENAYYKDIKVNHYPMEGSGEKNMLRNLEILEKAYSEEDPKDPRTEFYLGRQYFDLERHEEAEFLFKKYLKHSGWDEERAQANNYMALINLRRGELEEARNYLLEAIKEKPNFPTWYVNLGYTYALMEKWDEATHYLRLFVNTPPPRSGVVHVPVDDELRYYRALFMVAMGKKKTKEAEDAALALVKRFPRNKEYKAKYDSVVRLNELISITKGVETLIRELESQGETEKIQALINNLPMSVIDNAYVEQLRQKHTPAKTWPEKSIVYYTGRTFEEWTPDSLKTGLGGSETAVIHLAKRWKAMGYDVTVFGNVGANEGEYNGVTYKNFYRFNRHDNFDTVILWREPRELDFPYKAKNIWLDLHDVPNPMEYTKERVERVDKIFVKSKYHRDLLPDVPDEKFEIIPNGVDKRFAKIKGTNENYKFIYASSYDRGLEYMLRWGWPIIKKALPKATLDIYYGWNLFDSVHRNNPERMMWKKEMIELMGQDGITEHGRVGQKELLKAKANASVHYYATNFEEIDCISVRESALVGCVPVMTDYAALKEKKYGVRVKGDPNKKETHEKIAKKIVKLIKSGEIEQYRTKGIKKAKEEVWQKIAKRWVD